MNKEELDADIRAVVSYQGSQIFCGIFILIITFSLLLPTAAGFSFALLIKGIEVFQEGTKRNTFIAATCAVNALNLYVIWRLGTSKKRTFLTVRKDSIRNMFYAMTSISFVLCCSVLI